MWNRCTGTSQLEYKFEIKDHYVLVNINPYTISCRQPDTRNFMGAKPCMTDRVPVESIDTNQLYCEKIFFILWKGIQICTSNTYTGTTCTYLSLFQNLCSDDKCPLSMYHFHKDVSVYQYTNQSLLFPTQRRNSLLYRPHFLSIQP